MIGEESFQILLDGQFDRCVHPDRKDACPHQAHQVKGPDDGGLDEEWTVGMHEADKASTGDKFTIKFFVSHDGKPKRVTWEKIGGTQEVEAPPPPQKAPVGKFSSRAEEAEEAPREVAATPSRPAPAARRFDEWEEAKAPPTKPRWMREPEEPEEIPKQRGGHNWMSWADARAGDDVVEIERAARERLAKRLEDAAQLGMDMPMIADGSEDDPYKPERMRLTLAREEEERSGQVEANKERYRRSVEESVRERAAATKAKPRIKVPCQDCGQVNPSCMATVMYGSIMVCDTCLENWEALKEEGWSGDKLCGGLQAAQRVNQLVRANKGQMTPHEARLEVMREYGPSFRIN
uniref:Uncharacterized protein n=1 Tax=Alexandrium andersonii TaxID=327968 RepID=A0A7S2GCM3_9DINO